MAIKEQKEILLGLYGKGGSGNADFANMTEEQKMKVRKDLGLYYSEQETAMVDTLFWNPNDVIDVEFCLKLSRVAETVPILEEYNITNFVWESEDRGGGTSYEFVFAYDSIGDKDYLVASNNSCYYFFEDTPSPFSFDKYDPKYTQIIKKGLYIVSYTNGDCGNAYKAIRLIQNYIDGKTNIFTAQPYVLKIENLGEVGYYQKISDIVPENINVYNSHNEEDKSVKKRSIKDLLFNKKESIKDETKSNNTKAQPQGEDDYYTATYAISNFGEVWNFDWEEIRKEEKLLGYVSNGEEPMFLIAIGIEGVENGIYMDTQYPYDEGFLVLHTTSNLSQKEEIVHPIEEKYVPGSGSSSYFEIDLDIVSDSGQFNLTLKTNPTDIYNAVYAGQNIRIKAARSTASIRSGEYIQYFYPTSIIVGDADNNYRINYAGGFYNGGSYETEILEIGNGCDSTPSPEKYYVNYMYNEAQGSTSNCSGGGDLS